LCLSCSGLCCRPRLRFARGGVVQMFGIARKDRWAAVLPRMRALRDGFEPR
jgi:hypothetical protein